VLVTIDEALVAADRLRRPRQIAVRPAGRFTEVVGARLA
jgi:DNA repair protein RadD